MRLRSVLAAMAVALAAFPSRAAGCVETLAAVSVHELPQATLLRAQSVAWLRDGAVALGADSGVYEYALADRALKLIVPARTIPDGIRHVEDLATDGHSLVAYNLDYSDLAFDLAGSRILKARRFPALQILDIAVRDDTMVVLGYPAVLKRERNGALWSGKVGAKWESFRLLHKVSDEATDSLRSCFPPYGGAVAMQRDGTIAMITAAEPGVLRFRPDGTRVETLGKGLSELVPANMPEIRERFFSDFHGRYSEVLNRQPIADDLVDTAAGLAIVVRRFVSGSVMWELWFPGEGGGTRRRIRLAVDDRRTVGGHLRCHARGNKLACLFGKQIDPNAADKPHLMLFDLDRVTRKGKCGP